MESIGSASIQGDARFCRVLEAMGCRVKQTAGSTTVTAPADKQLKAVDVDMSDVTDTFMTAAVLMATTPPGSVSRITNIANQRVKECDRIAAMAANFAQCGIEARELPDGLEIVGCGRVCQPFLHTILLSLWLPLSVSPSVSPSVSLSVSLSVPL